MSKQFTDRKPLFTRLRVFLLFSFSERRVRISGNNNPRTLRSVFATGQYAAGKSSKSTDARARARACTKVPKNRTALLLRQQPLQLHLLHLANVASASNYYCSTKSAQQLRFHFNLLIAFRRYFLSASEQQSKSLLHESTEKIGAADSRECL